ncbi:MAG: dihydropteroate synthase [Rhodoferax sp.]
MHWQTTRYPIDLRAPVVMGIVNVTPDSFSDGGQYQDARRAMAHCEQLLADGAGILDIGGESTRPGAPPVPLQEELARVLPVLRHALTLGVPVSVDSYKPAVMQAALELGADIINDVWALRWRGDDGLDGAQVVAAHPSCGVCLMHMHREPQTMQQAPMEGDAVSQVLSFLKQRIEYLRGLGVDLNRITADPGIGFGKTVAQNFRLLARQGELAALGVPVLAGWSRKSSLAAVTQTSLSQAAALLPQDRMVPSVAAAVLAVEHGARVVRVHDVKETVQALKVWGAMRENGAAA